SVNVLKAFEVGRRLGLLTVALTGKDGGPCAEIADYAFAVPSHNILRIQECHLTLYHILWDMVHTLLHYDPSFRTVPTVARPAGAEHTRSAASGDVESVDQPA